MGDTEFLGYFLVMKEKTDQQNKTKQIYCMA